MVDPKGNAAQHVSARTVDVPDSIRMAAKALKYILINSIRRK
jgi:hypothetical protein